MEYFGDRRNWVHLRRYTLSLCAVAAAPYEQRNTLRRELDARDDALVHVNVTVNCRIEGDCIALDLSNNGVSDDFEVQFAVGRGGAVAESLPWGTPESGIAVKSLMRAARGTVFYAAPVSRGVSLVGQVVVLSRNGAAPVEHTLEVRRTKLVRLLVRLDDQQWEPLDPPTVQLLQGLRTYVERLNNEVAVAGVSTTRPRTISLVGCGRI